MVPIQNKWPLMESTHEIKLRQSNTYSLDLMHMINIG